MPGPLDLTIGFLTKQCADAVKENVELVLLQLSNPKGLLDGSTQNVWTGNILEDLIASPVGQLGQDYLFSQVQTTTAKQINKVNQDVSQVLTNLENIQQTVFNSLIASMLVKNDMMLYFLQRLAANILAAYDEKRAATVKLQERLRMLHNAMMILNSMPGQFAGYLGKVRKAVILIHEAEKEIRVVRDTFSRNDFFLVKKFQTAQDKLQEAISFIEPDRNQRPANQFDVDTLLEAVGLPTEAEAQTALMSIPVLARECLLASEDYLTSTLKINAMLAAFVGGLDNISKTSSGKFKDYTVTVLSVALDQLTAIRQDIATAVNGDPNLIDKVKDLPFRASTRRITGASVEWLIELKAIRELLKTVPVQGLRELQFSNSVVAAYRSAAAFIQTKGDRHGNLAILKATAGQEDVLLLEGQLFSFLTASQQVLVRGFAPKGLLSLSKGVQQRLQLATDQDDEIKAALLAFVNTPLPDSVKRLVDTFMKLLRSLGMDRIADLLDQGAYDDFFNSDSKTSTYVGAAMVGLAALKDCLGINFPFDLMGLLKGFFFAFALKLNRSAASGIGLQITFNLKKLDACSGLTARMRGLGSICGLKDNLAPSRLFSSLSGALGVGAGKRITG